MKQPDLPLQSRILLPFFERITSWSYSALFSLWLSMVLLFGFLYFLLSLYTIHHGLAGMETLHPLSKLGDSLYFSVVTATTVGYGDLLPQGFSKFLTMLESVSAFFVFGTFTTKILSQRSETILDELHRFMFNTNTQHLRESLYIVRSDFNTIMDEARERHQLSERAWDMFAVASTEGQRILEEIPSFYDHQDGNYAIDTRREKLILEALHRTLHRLWELLQVLNDEGIEWRKRAQSHQELEAFLTLAASTLPRWKKQSRNGNRTQFDALIVIIKKLRKERRKS